VNEVAEAKVVAKVIEAEEEDVDLAEVIESIELPFEVEVEAEAEVEISEEETEEEVEVYEEETVEESEEEVEVTEVPLQIEESIEQLNEIILRHDDQESGIEAIKDDPAFNSFLINILDGLHDLYVRPDYARAERPSRPEHIGRPDYASAERPERPERVGRPDYASVERPGRPDYASAVHPGRPDFAGAERPEGIDRPDFAPERPDRPSHSERPDFAYGQGFKQDHWVTRPEHIRPVHPSFTYSGEELAEVTTELEAHLIEEPEEVTFEDEDTYVTADEESPEEDAESEVSAEEDEEASRDEMFGRGYFNHLNAIWNRRPEEGYKPTRPDLPEREHRRPEEGYRPARPDAPERSAP